MSKFLKTAMPVFVSNMVFVVLFAANKSSGDFLAIGLVWIMYLIIQFLLGILLALQSKYNEIGKGILFGAGMGMLIGFAVCSQPAGGA